MENLEMKIQNIILNKISSSDLKSEILHKTITKEIVSEIIKDKNSDFYNLLHLCEIVEKEKNGLLFIKKMIINLIT